MATPIRIKNIRLTAEEKRFVRLWMSGLDHFNIDSGFYLSPFVLTMYGILTVILGTDLPQRFIALFFGWALVGFIGLAVRPRQEFRFLLALVAIMLPMATAAINMADAARLGDAMVMSRQNTTFIASIIFLGLLTGNRYKIGVAATGTMLALYTWLNWDTAVFRMNFSVYVVVACATQGMIYVITFFHRNVALRELSIRMKMAPAHVVQNSGVDLEGLEKAFESRPRTGVYVSSDWRGYQQLSDSLDMEKLSRSLSEYYDVCEKILSESFRDGNFYFDWIADELFIVLIETDQMPIGQVAQEAVKTCVKLMKAKHRFYKTYGFPKSIDIGVSCGEAYVGMMGPKSFRKATALGRVPGRSRRMQSLGKHLRQTIGDYDRVIFGDDVRSYLGDETGATLLTLDTAAHAKDLTDQKVYFLLPRYTDSASPPTEYFEPKDAA